MIGKINIFGPIGKYEENGKVEGVSLLDIISQVKALPQDTQIIEVHIASPGGYVDEGDNIFNYLESLKKTFVVNTIQDGNIASIATKLFLVGMQRVADQKFDFMIHNPWIDPGPGDSQHQADVLEGLLAEEEKLRKFYSKILDITEEGLKPLMDQETTMTANQLIGLGFATSLKANKPVMAMAMAKEGNKGFNFADKLKALQKSIKALGGVQALDLQTVDGKTLSVDAPNEDSLVGAPAMIDGQPAPDGDYTIAPDDSGMSDVVSVKGGVVTAVAEQPVAALPQAKEIEAKVSNLEKVVSQLTDAVTALLEANKEQGTALVTSAVEEADKKAEARIQAAVKAVKDEIGTVHTPRIKASEYSPTVDKTETGFKSISQRMKEKEDARKSKIK